MPRMTPTIVTAFAESVCLHGGMYSHSECLAARKMTSILSVLTERYLLSACYKPEDGEGVSLKFEGDSPDEWYELWFGPRCGIEFSLTRWRRVERRGYPSLEKIEQVSVPAKRNADWASCMGVPPCPA